MKIRIKTFADQDSARAALSEIVAKHTESIIHRVDLVTSDGDGLEAMAEDESFEEFPEYTVFREWLGPVIAQSSLALIGQVLQACEVTDEGYAHIDLQLLATERDACDPRAGLGARLVWLVAELPSLHEAFHQLYPTEVLRMEELVSEVDAGINLAVEEDIKRAKVIWPELEELFLLAQPGARIARHDEEAVAGAVADLDAWAKRIEQREVTEARKRSILAGALTPEGAEDIRQGVAACNEAIANLESDRRRLQDHQRSTNKRLEKVSARLMSLLTLAAEADIEVGA